MLTWYKIKRLLAGVAAVLIVVFLILSAFSLALEPRVPRNYVSGLSEKFYAYPGLKPCPDIVFVGSSRVYRGAFPEYVEGELNRGSQTPLSVYNFGIGGMTAPMLAKTVDFISDTSTKPQLVLMEPQMVMGAAFETDVSDRSMFENQFSTFPLGVLQILTQSDGGLLRRMKGLGEYLLSFARTGLGTSAVRNMLIHDDIYSLLDLKSYPMQHAGAYPLDEEFKRAKKKRQQKLEQREKENSGEKGMVKVRDDVKKINRLMGKKARPMTVMERWYVELLLSRANSANIRCGFVFMPMRNPVYVERQRAISQYVREHHPEVPVLETSPLQMPELYKEDRWFDGGHLNAEGARIYSREMGRQLAVYLAEGALN